MAKHIARYSVTYGLSGCYMPDSSSGPIACATRGELASLIKSELETYEMPASLFAEVKIRRLWTLIARNGSSVAHFHLNHGANVLSFHGLTVDEFNEMDSNEF
jgi:hypothetical protein